MSSPIGFLIPPRWKNYSQVSPQKNLENFTFSLVGQVVPAGVLRQGVVMVHGIQLYLICEL